MQKDELQHIYEGLKSMYIDIRAEVLIAEILEHTDTDLSDFTISPKSTFSRTYRRDVIDYQYGHTKFDEYNLTLNLSRSGIYDTLPEGVFHNAADSGLKNLSHQKKREVQKKEERDARLFFQPIENEIFGQQVAIEQKERELYNHFASIKNNFLLEFWKIADHLPKALVVRLIKLLPYAHSVVGDMENTALCLEKILDQKVSIEPGWSEQTTYGDSKKGETLGVDFVLTSKEATILSPHITVHIGPVDPKEAHKYVEGHPLLQFLDVFYDYFVPMEMDVSTDVEIITDTITFTINENDPSLMGLTTVI